LFLLDFLAVDLLAEYYLFLIDQEHLLLLHLQILLDYPILRLLFPHLHHLLM